MQNKYRKKIFLIIFLSVLLGFFIFSSGLGRPVMVWAAAYSAINDFLVSSTTISYTQEWDGYACVKAYPYM